MYPFGSHSQAAFFVGDTVSSFNLYNYILYIYKAETVLSAVSYIYKRVDLQNCFQSAQ